MGPGVHTVRSCDREPVHIPGRIQAYGAMLVADAVTRRLLRAGGDCETLLGQPAQAVVQASLAELFDHDSQEDVRFLLETAGERPNAIRMLHPAADPARSLVATACRSGGAVLLECEAARPVSLLTDLLRDCQDVQTHLRLATDIPALWQSMTDSVRHLTGFDRVMLYKFHDDFSGEVVAEAMDARLRPFLGHRYPASDIPEPARQLYLQNWLRIIPDVHVAQPPLEPCAGEESSPPLDMTHARLRAVSPIHIEYLKNMGVEASLSLSVLVAGRLWGLVACHHYAGPRFLHPEQQRALVLIAGDFSHALEALLAQQAERQRQVKDALLASLQGKISGTQPLEALVRRIAPDLMQLVDAEGVALVDNGEIIAMGRTPAASVVVFVADWLSRQLTDDIHATNALGRDLPESQAWRHLAAGVLGLRLGGYGNIFLLWFRPEIVVEELWGGDPQQPYTMHPKSGVAHPRTSFETFRLEITGLCTAWTRHDMYAVKRLVPLFNAHMLRIADAVLRISEQRFRLLVERAQEGIVVLQDWRLAYFNPMLMRMTGYAEDELAGEPFLQFVLPEDRPLVHDRHLMRLAGQDDGQRYRFRALHRNGSTVWVESSGVNIEWNGRPATLSFMMDITDRLNDEERIRFMAHYDALTALPNRTLFFDRLHQSLAQARREQARLAIAFIDLDKFKPVNDLYGHAVGDLLLQAVARRITGLVRESDTVARLGGDEFVLLMPGIAMEAHAVRVAQKIQDALDLPFALAGHEIHISSSIGIAIYPDHGQTEQELCTNADKAMYRVKHGGRSGIALHQEPSAPA
ncbi:putative phytochrome-like protein Cph1 family protein [Megalodesulfovibrio gigas DSM 1382 = ATCC 19364]|uniref:Putative phytochrome-like protein Cph1 family protein n=2 Tax=Megalodesulfovibrio gigas TaxID=879 RepID=T2GDX4_MEGG1|nr:putative phytochrome-like protein Cph1 family protein [Megalodesulfovibrio gigas DSM 1382 = ATCC 19364]